MEPLPISVIMPARNSGTTVARAVRSALQQSPRPPLEVIVSDDASQDDTAERAAAAGAWVIRHDEHVGVSAGRNAAIRVASGEWIATLDADDVWLPNHLETVWRRLGAEVLVSTSALACGPNPAEDRIFGVPRTLRLRTPRQLLVPNNPIVLSAALFRRDLAIAAGLFPAGIARSEDLDLWIRILERGPGLALADVTVLYAIHDAQASTDRDAMRVATLELAQTYREREWWSRAFERTMAGGAAWDELRTGIRCRDLPRVVMSAWRLAASPRRMLGAVALLRARALLRRRLSHPATDLAEALSTRRRPEWTLDVDVPVADL